MLILFIRAIMLFLMTVVMMRVMGKRQVAQLQPYELVLAILISDLAAAPMGDSGKPLLYGLVPMLALVFMHTVLTLCCMKSERLRKLIDGQSYSVINNGELRNKEIDRLGFSISDLLEELRAAGFERIEEVDSAIIETSGKLSAFRKPANRPATVSDLKLQANVGGIPLPVILSGRVQKDNLASMRVTEAWLLAKLTRAGIIDKRTVALCSLATDGTLVVFSREDVSAPRVIKSDAVQGARA